MLLPSRESAVVDPYKVREYLLNPDHPDGRPKAAFFQRLGFDRSRWIELRWALLELAAYGKAEQLGYSAFGAKYSTTGRIQGPNGRSASVVAIWIIETGTDWPRLVTAYPGGER